MQTKSIHRILARLLLLTMLTAMLLPCFAFSAGADNTYIITDGGGVTVRISSSTRAEDVLEEAGIILGEDDSYILRTTEGGDTEIHIQRLMEVIVGCDNKRQLVPTYETTVGALLTALGIKPGPEDRVTWPLNDKVFHGMSIDVIRVTRQTVTEEKPIPCPMKYYVDAGLGESESKPLLPGVNGTKQVTQEVVYENGVEVSRTVKSEKTLTEPKEGVTLVGTKAAKDIPADKLGKAQYLDCLGTAYSCDGRKGITATGTVVHIGTIAVDPKVIPLHSKLYITSQDGSYVYGYATAEDTGGLIKGNRVDLYMNTTAECIQFGARRVNVYVLS